MKKTHDVTFFASKLDDFLTDSQPHASVTIDLMFCIDKETFIASFLHFLETGENLLPELSRAFKLKEQLSRLGVNSLFQNEA